MFKLGFFVFMSIMLFYAAWVYYREASRQKFLVWINANSQQMEGQGKQTPLQVLTAVCLKVFGFLFPKGIAAQNTRERLNWAGYSQYDVETYYTIRIMLFIVPVVMYPIIMRDMAYSYLFGIGAGSVLFMLPETLLKRRIQYRNNAVEKELLPVTELLVTSIEAGLTIEQAIQRITRVKSGHFSNILKQGYQYMEGVLTRDESYEWMMKQTNVESVHIFLEAIQTAQKNGTSLSMILRQQLDRIRNDIQNKGIERAQAINGKMMLPTALFIFIPLLILVLAPQILALRNL